ncbi:hypothetical protein [Nocardioides marmoriginsengisoli]|uniref:hypothetical protein n=1 Tax=Nocardioides marmoriginsengisoli TaxID=661483 RepID=UPI0016109E5A|nr:hypothetical protein [Nocardioides marmoriginsengisoli]
MSQYVVSFQNTGRATARRATTRRSTADKYAEEVVADLRETLRRRIERIAATGATLPSPEALADLLAQTLPDVPDELDPHFADLAPFYASDGAIRQLGGISKQALADRRRSETVLAMRSGDGPWLYPAWQFTGDGRIHPALAPVLKALRGSDGWVAGVWLTSEHPDLDGRSPRTALREGTDPHTVAALAAHDMAALAA